ncbi:site-2 protease family protein [Lentibacillus sp. CBA3610]|uniref:site-2 protease family protein n=1 Tax=Lentibacillus sp. CBA3610 TaxID=2518176 RepID=UPI0015957634|nr:site-2 protease family protein [Lentibacillus sp. CBA3610]QKY69240.1 hypothetical protein Len3610_06130 [Lentibacillus sp. CBA3610]
MTIYLVVYLILFAAPFGTLIHEIGHVLGAKLVSADKITLTMGAGSTIFRFVWNKTDISIRVLFFLGGMAGSERRMPYQSTEQIIIAALGPVSSIIASGLCYGLYNVYPNSYLLILLLFNLWIAVLNIVPFRIKDKKSDGFVICQAIRKR